MKIVIGTRETHPLRMPEKVERRVERAIRNRSLGIVMHYSGAAVNTEQNADRRTFPPFASDRSMVIEPLALLNQIGVPVAMLSGNNPGYLDSLCTDGYRSWLYDRGWLGAMERFRTYHRGGTSMRVYNGEGRSDLRARTAYADQYRIPREHMDPISKAFLDAADQVLGRGIASSFEITARPTSSDAGEAAREVSLVRGRVFQNRWSQGALMYVPAEHRESIVAAALDMLDPTIAALYSFMPSGESSINVSHLGVTRNTCVDHFMQDLGLSMVLYFGSSVYTRNLRAGRSYEGKDLAVARNQRAVVFAVNRDQDLVPSWRASIVPAGIGPDATAADSTKAWATWLVNKYVSVLFAANNLSMRERKQIMMAIVESELTESIDVA